MNDVIQAILQVGVAPTIAGYLLYDYSKRLLNIEKELIYIKNELVDQTKLLEELCKRKRK